EMINAEKLRQADDAYVNHSAFAFLLRKTSIPGGHRRLESRFQHTVEKRTQPGFVASPALDGVAINRLAGLPLARRLHRARIAFGAEAGVVPRQTATCDDPPNH